ncbi:MAG: hypothetical protein L0Y56_03805 [Nitrospira sp.]|nr:hypothetical protein [Nitrospira sp.]
MLSKHEKERAAIMGQLRVLHDGDMQRESGVDKEQQWKGRVTIIAGVTPVLEREVEVLRELGERFLHVRWHRADSLATGRKAIEQLSQNEDKVSAEAQARIAAIVDPPTLPPLPPIPEKINEPLCNVAELGAQLRTGVVRDRYGNQPIMEVPEPEGVAGLAKGLARLLQCHAALFRREIDPSDMRLARRVLFDSIRYPRLKVFRSLPQDGTPLSEAETIRLCEMPRSTVRRHLEDLEAIGAVQPIHDGVENMHKLTEKFVTLVTPFHLSL